jgi:hypothetical protein
MMPHEVVDKVEEILNNAFPTLANIRDGEEGYVNYCLSTNWSISTSVGGWEITEEELNELS